MLLSLLLAAAPLTITPDFEGFEQRFSAPTDTTLSKLGLGSCGSNKTTSQPSLTFIVPPGGRVVLRLADAPDGAVLTFGDRLQCLTTSVTNFEKPGTYSLHLLDTRERPSVAVATVNLISIAGQNRKILATHRLTLEATGENPVRFTSPPAVLSTPAEAGVRCSRNPLRPLATLEVKAASSFTVRPQPENTYVLMSNGTCAPANHVELQPGLHTLWRAETTGAVDFSVRDDERAIDFGSAPRFSTKTLPAAIRVKASGGSGSNCPKAGRAPSAYVERVANEPAHTWPKVMAGDTAVTFDFVSDTSTWCDHPEFPTASGWIFVNTKSGRDADVLLVAATEEDWPRRWSSGQPTTDLSVSDRATAWHFPLWPASRKDVSSLFEVAPPGLFVFLNKPIKEVPTTEPLLVRSVTDDKAVLLRLDGSTLEVRLSVVATTKPAELTFPALPKYEPAKTFDEALEEADEADAAVTGPWLEQRTTHIKCVQRFMEKNDPSWKTSYTLIYVNSGRTTTEVQLKRAKASCNAPKFDKLTASMIASVNTAHARRRAALVDVLNRKFKE